MERPVYFSMFKMIQKYTPQKRSACISEEIKRHLGNLRLK